MLLDDFEIRWLTIEDKTQYIELVNSNKKLLKMEKTSRDNEIILKIIDYDFSDPQRKVVGAFLKGKLVVAMSGFFPAESLHWYAFNHFHLANLGNDNLSTADIKYLVWPKCMSTLTDYAEQHGYYSFYSRRPLTHQKAFEKLWNRFKNEEKVNDRYDCYHEMIYPAGAESRSITHNFYFSALHKTVGITTIICLYALKQNYREELLKKEYEN